MCYEDTLLTLFFPLYSILTAMRKLNVIYCEKKYQTGYSQSNNNNPLTKSPYTQTVVVFEKYFSDKIN